MTEFLQSRYRLIEVLGQGSMGVVWRAQDTVLDRPVALKELRPPPGLDAAEARERFVVEARAAARLSHPNIVGVHDVFTDGERVLIAMELVEGPTLDQVLAAWGPQPAPVVRAIMAQVAQALAVAHGAGVVHRDLKPGNVFWTTEGRAVVCDFGLARIGAGRGTVTGTVMGTPGYMAPEQVRGLEAGPAADVFAWGAVAYELATGRPPFGDPDTSALAYRIVHEDPPFLDLPDDPLLAEIVARSLAKEVSQRPADGRELLSELLSPAEDSSHRPGVVSVESLDQGQSGRRPPRRRATAAASIGGLLLLLVLLGAVLVSRPSGPTSSQAEPPATSVEISAPSTAAPATSLEISVPSTAPSAIVTVPVSRPPLRLPTGVATQGVYETGRFRPVVILQLGEGWRSSNENPDEVDLSRTGMDYPWLKLLHVRGVVGPAWRGPESDGTGAEILPPGELGRALEHHSQVVATPLPKPLAGLAGSWDVVLRDGAGYRALSCDPCAELLTLEGDRVFFLKQGQKARLYMFSPPGGVVVVAAVMPASQFDDLVPVAEGVVRTIRFG